MTTEKFPRAIRATVLLTRSPIGRVHRSYRYDVLYADGRIELDVNVDVVLNGRRSPADVWATRNAAEKACAEGCADWIEYATCRRLGQTPEN